MSTTALHDALGINAGEEALVATVGGGGKTTLLFALADERATVERPGQAPRISVLTTTTKFTIPARAGSWPLVVASSVASRAAAIEHAWSRERRAIIVGSGRGDRERVQGVEPGWPRAILELDIVDFVGVEADGSAGRPFKAPAEHEPVIPERPTLVVGVVGVGALGKPLDERAVHRPERVRAIAAGESVTPAMIATVLSDPRGGRKDVPPEAAFAVVVSGASRDPQGTAAIATACHELGIERVVAYDAPANLVELV